MTTFVGFLLMKSSSARYHLEMILQAILDLLAAS